MTRPFYTLLFTILSLSSMAQQKEIPSFSLKQAVDYAKKNNYAIKNGQLDVTYAQKKVKETLSIGLPQINASGNFTNNTVLATNVINFGGQSTALQFGQPFSVTGSITASQLLFDGGFLMGVKAAKEFVALSEINVNRNNIETEINVTKAYYGALLLQTNVTLLEVNISTLDSTRKNLEAIYKVGLIEKTDLDRITLQYSTIVLQREKIIDQQRLATMVLKLQMGMNVNDSIVLTDNLQQMYESTTIPVVAAKVDYNKRPEFQLLDQQLKLNTLDKKRYQYGYAPSIAAFASTQKNTFGTDFGNLGSTWYQGTFWGINMSLPIFDGFNKSAKIQQSKINIAKNENDKKNLENAIDQEVLRAKLTFERSGQQLQIQQSNLALAQDIFNRVQLKYRNGTGSSLDVTNSQNDLESARSLFLNTIYDFFIAQIELRKAIGDIK